jgi:hypothetical protein
MNSKDPTTIRLPQDRETPLTTAQAPFGTALYLYARSIDSVNAETIGQDYVTLRYGQEDIVFAVCDGVGQSFMGDLAARILGDGLVDWLWTRKRPADEDAFREAVSEALNSLTETSSPQVEDYQLPATIPPLLKAALEMQREYGSESMFVAGRIALGGKSPWVGLCWLGDSPVAAVDYDGELVDLGPRGHTSERWNATTGLKGEIHTWVGDAAHVARVAGYTDGLGTEHVPTDADLAKMMEFWLKNPPSDDASLVDIRLATSRETIGGDLPDEEEAKLIVAVARKSTTNIVMRLPSGKTPTEVPALPEPTPEPVAESAPEPIEPPKLKIDDSRPLPTIGEQTSPVKEMDPIQKETDSGPTTGEWRPLVEKAEDKKAEELPAKGGVTPQAPPTGDIVRKVVELAAADPREQIAMWQQAALLGLTSAALAMLMMEQLVNQNASDEEKDQ